MSHLSTNLSLILSVKMNGGTRGRQSFLCNLVSAGAEQIQHDRIGRRGGKGGGVKEKRETGNSADVSFIL
jgi:hypothetical protein